MLELEHWRVGVWVHSCEPRTGHRRDYIAGRDKPHYPVPAIDYPCYRDYQRGDISLKGLLTYVALLT